MFCFSRHSSSGSLIKTKVLWQHFCCWLTQRGNVIIKLINIKIRDSHSATQKCQRIRAQMKILLLFRLGIFSDRSWKQNRKIITPRTIKKEWEFSVWCSKYYHCVSITTYEHWQNYYMLNLWNRTSLIIISITRDH